MDYPISDAMDRDGREPHALPAGGDARELAKLRTPERPPRDDPIAFSYLVVDRQVAIRKSGAQRAAHAEVEAFDPSDGAWQAMPSMVQGRHGTGAILFDGKLWTAAGSGNRGGGPELDTLEALQLP